MRLSCPLYNNSISKKGPFQSFSQWLIQPQSTPRFFVSFINNFYINIPQVQNDVKQNLCQKGLHCSCIINMLFANSKKNICDECLWANLLTLSLGLCLKRLCFVVLCNLEQAKLDSIEKRKFCLTSQYNFIVFMKSLTVILLELNPKIFLVRYVHPKNRGYAQWIFNFCLY